MVRMGALVIPRCPHPVTHRGDRRQPVYFRERHYCTCLAFAGDACARAETAIRACCVMPKDVHVSTMLSVEWGKTTIVSKGGETVKTLVCP